MNGGRLGIVALLVALTAPARAQEDTDRLATATSLFDAAQKSVQQGQAEEACPMFEESYRLEPANGTLINLADCYERVGRTASAWLTFRQVAHKSEAEGQSERARVARERADQLRPRLVHIRVTVDVKARVPGLVVERDAVELTGAMLGMAVPVDPGEHEVRARAPGRRPWTHSATADQEGKTIEIAVPPLASIAPAAAPRPVAAPEPQRGNDWQVPLGIATLSVGAAALIAGVALGGAAKQKADDADCDAENFCSPEGLTDRDDAVLLGNVGTGVGIAGAGLAAVGLTLWLTAPSDDAKSARLVLGPAGGSLRIAY
jgi:serine/threonine-protein kinase